MMCWIPDIRLEQSLSTRQVYLFKGLNNSQETGVRDIEPPHILVKRDTFKKTMNLNVYDFALL